MAGSTHPQTETKPPVAFDWVLTMSAGGACNLMTYVDEMLRASMEVFTENGVTHTTYALAGVEGSWNNLDDLSEVLRARDNLTLEQHEIVHGTPYIRCQCGIVHVLTFGQPPETPPVKVRVLG